MQGSKYKWMEVQASIKDTQHWPTAKDQASQKSAIVDYTTVLPIPSMQHNPNESLPIHHRQPTEANLKPMNMVSIRE
jgi:hypothetical protein